MDIRRLIAELSPKIKILYSALGILSIFGILLCAGAFDSSPYTRGELFLSAAFLVGVATLGIIARLDPLPKENDTPAQDIVVTNDPSPSPELPIPVAVASPHQPRVVTHSPPPRRCLSAREREREHELLIRHLADAESRLIWIKHLPAYAEYEGIITQILAGTKELASPGEVPEDQVAPKTKFLLGLFEREAQLHDTPPVQRAISKVRRLEDTLRECKGFLQRLRSGSALYSQVMVGCQGQVNDE